MDNINFNAKQWLDDKGIKYHTGGKNTIKGAISLRCCFHNDFSNHLNLFNDGWAKCWNCGNKSIKEVIKEVEKCSWRDVYSIIKKYSNYLENPIEQEEIEFNGVSSFKMPKEFSTTFQKDINNT